MMKTDRERFSKERHRQLHEMMDRILETGYAELLAGMIELLYNEEMQRLQQQPTPALPPSND